MSFTQIRVKDTRKDPQLVPVTEMSVVFRLSVAMQDAGADLSVEPKDITGTYNSSGVLIGPDGQEGVVLSATNDPGTVPAGVTYRVQVFHRSSLVRAYSIVVPYDAEGKVLQLADVPPATTLPLYYYAPLSDYRAEVASLEAADAANAAAISAESTARASADTTLQTSIASEASARAAADTAEASARAAAVNAEASARAVADAAEAAARESADEALQQALSSEATARGDADTTLTASLAAHTTNHLNPHSTTAAQVGAIAASLGLSPGDMLVCVAPGVWSIIPVGSPGQVWTVHPITGLPAWVDAAAPPAPTSGNVLNFSQASNSGWLLAAGI